MSKKLLEELLRENDNEDYSAPVHQDRLFLIMWKSNRSGGTYSELRKSVQGAKRFIRGLLWLGFNLKHIKVEETHKTWVPEKKSRG